MIKKFNEYASEEIDREEWPSAPDVKSSQNLTDREKIEMVKSLFDDCDCGKISPEDLVSKLGNILGRNKTFPGSTKM